MPGLLGEPWAVSQMLGLLAQQPPAGQPGQPAPMPAAPMNVQPQQNLLGKVHDAIAGLLGGSAPAGWESVLSPQEIQSAKPGIMQSLGHSGAYETNLERLLALKQQATAMQEHSRLRDVRTKMLSQFAESPNESHTDRLNRLERMFAYALQNGDKETANELKGVVAETAIANKPPVEKQFEPKLFVGPKGQQQWVTPGQTPPAGFSPYQAPRENADDKVLVQVEGPDGPVFVPRAQAIGMSPPTKQGAQEQAAEGLFNSSVSEMNNGNRAMIEYEKKLASGQVNISGLSQFMGAVGSSFTHDDVASRAIQNAALIALNHTNPELARYIRRGLAFAEGEAGISKRPSDFRTKMAAFLSTAASGASPGMISDIQSRRNAILTPLNEIVAKKPHGATRAGSVVPSYEDWKKSKGK